MTELDDEARLALRRGLALDGPSAERRARVKQRLVVTLGGGAVSLGAAASAAAEGSAPVLAASAGAGTATGGAGLAAWFGTGVLGGALVAGAIAISSTHTPAPAASGRVAAPPPAARLASSARASIPPALESADEPALEASAPRPERPPSRPVAAPVGSDEPGIGEEALLLQRAQRALAASEGSRALALLAEHERRFPTGQLREERQVATVLALCSLGRVDAARALAHDFRARSPHSVLIPRLDRSCASADGK
jgi:hypothetical protein